jgi:ABC-2 type transport system ATP-binding protein
LLVFENVSLNFPNKPLFNDLNLSLTESRVLLTGNNGSGKTTLLLLAAGLQAAQQGSVSLNGSNVTSTIAKKDIGISAAKVALPPFFTTQAFLKFHCRIRKCALDTDLIDQLSLTPFLATNINDLSLGNYKKLSLLTALMHQPRLLLLDEPFNGLDVSTRSEFELILKAYEGQVIIASHEPTSFDEQTLMHLTMHDINQAAH